LVLSLPGLLLWVSLVLFLEFASHGGVVQLLPPARVRHILRLAQGLVDLRDARCVVLIQVRSYRSGKAITAMPL
jgi:hypothetical protein